MLRIGFAGVFAARLAEPVRARLRIPCEVLLDAHAGSAAAVPDVDILVTMAFTREMARSAAGLRLLQVPGASLDRIDRTALPSGTWLANAYGHEVGIAEYVIGAMVAVSRSFARVDARLRRGEWESQWAVGAPPPLWPELAGKTLGILGYGRIGQCVARRARAFDMTVVTVRREPAAADPAGVTVLRGPDALGELLTRADYVALTLPLTPATRGLLKGPELRRMKPTAILINVARAEIVDEDALYEALAEGAIGGAVLDVWYRYPSGPEPTLPARRAFHALPNVLMTPHVSGWTEGMLEARATLIAENIHRTARGELPLNLIAT
jgi:phosphoglycerate dehydrogenase-like enzyme